MRPLDDLLLSGPGHDGYTYNADVFCVSCGQDIIRDLYKTDPSVFDVDDDSDSQPMPIFFGESACEEHCAECHNYLYGNNPAEPIEDDYTTQDHQHFYQYGKCVVVVPGEEEWRPYVKEHMDREQFWPNVWFISDHGNTCLLEV